MGSSTPIEPKARGRLRRRERRRNLNRPKKPGNSKGVDIKEYLEEKGFNPLQYEYGSENLTSGERWLYNSGEIGRKDPGNQSSAALVLELDQVSSNNKFTVSAHNSPPCRLNESDQVRTYLPLIRIRTVSNSGPKIPTPRKFHLVSYFTEMAPEEDDNKGDISPTWRPHQYRTSQVHVADLIDEMGFLDATGYKAESFISVIDCNPGALIPSVASLQLSFLRNPKAADERNTYWQKFAVLTVGISSMSREFVDLPYSQGYGVVHGFPTLFYRESRWGYFDVDNVSRDSKRPRWRASWRFEVSNVEDQSSCAGHGIDTDYS